MNLKNLLLCILTTFAVVSCTSDDFTLDSGNGSGTVENIVFTIEDWKTENDTRAWSLSDGRFMFLWDDYITVVPSVSNVLGRVAIKFPVSPGDDCASYSITANAGWDMKNNVWYSAFYPSTYDIVDDKTNFELTYSDWASINPEISTEHKFVLWASAKAESSHIKFTFKRKYALIKVALTGLPKKKWKRLVISNKNGEKVFYMKGTLDIPTGNVFKDESSGFSSYEFFTNQNTASTTLYCMFPTLSTTTGTIRCLLEDSEGEKYETFIASKTLYNGYFYTLTNIGTVQPVPEYMDLGLPSGLKWATMNLGANSAIECGDYYEWGVTETTPVYDEWWEGHKWVNEDGTFKKYNQTDKLTTLEEEDDAACVNLGNGWRMPTHAELQELINNSYIVWTTNYDNTNVAGCIIYKAKKTSDKGKFVPSGQTPLSSYTLSDDHIFLPANGAWYLGGHYDTTECNYWSSTVYKNLKNAHIMSFNPNKCEANENRYARFCHVGIRPVRE